MNATTQTHNQINDWADRLLALYEAYMADDDLTYPNEVLDEIERLRRQVRGQPWRELPEDTA